jgi:glutathione synthetase
MSTPEYADYVSRILLKKRPLQQIVEEALDFAHCHGLAMRTSEHRDRSDICQVAPMALFPSPFPAHLLKQALEAQDAMTELYFYLAWDYDFLIEAHKDVIKTDIFTRKMVEIYQKVWKEGIPQTKSLVTQRADYMADVSKDPKGLLRQIEVNNIAVSMGGLAQRVSKWHRKIITELEGKDPGDKIPINEPVDTLGQGLYHAWLEMGDENAIILVIIEDVNQNQLDQRFIEYHVSSISSGKVKFIRATLTECASRLKINDKKDLILDGEKRVTVCYFRSGYSPSNYPTDTEWDARLTMEQSNAIKCPWIGLQLANTKKVQQVLTQPSTVEKYFPGDLEKVHRIRSTFAAIWGLENDNEETRALIEDAIKNPNRYVLKPQLEGGGGNFYGEEIISKLQTFSKDELAAHILMEKINPLAVENVLVRAFRPSIVSKVVSELGTYGFVFGESTKVLRVYSHGHILRSKAEDVNEGGVAVGAAVIDSAYLV